MFKGIIYHIIVPLAVTLAGIFIYHYAVTLPVTKSLARIQEGVVFSGANISPTVITERDEASVRMDVQEEKEKNFSVKEMGAASLEFEIPHTVTSDGETLAVPITAKVTHAARYVLNEAIAQGSVEVAICNGVGECGLPIADVPLRSTQVFVALDIEFTNKNRVGTVAIDPAQQMRFIYASNFYLPYVMGGGAYIEAPELSTVRKTISAYISRSAEVVDFIYGADLERPSGLLRFDFQRGTIEALSG